MAKIDNERMWASMLNYKPTTEERERISRALMSDRSFPFGVVKNILIRGALREQGLMEKDGEIVDYEPQFKAGDWVVHGKSTCCVSEVLDKQLMVIVPSIFGGVKTLYDAADVHKWTLADAKNGDYLTCDDGTESKVIFISHGCDDNLYLAYAGYATDKGESMFFTDETCCLAKKKFIRPAKDDEKLILDEQIAAHDLHWNLDRMELVKVDHTVKAAFPDSDYEQMRKEVDDLRQTVEALQRQIDHMASKDMPLGGDTYERSKSSDD